MKTVIEMAIEAGLIDFRDPLSAEYTKAVVEDLTAFAELVRADERKEITKLCEEFARKWWKIYCDSNLHHSSTLKAHQDFCALQAVIRNRSKT